MSSKDFRDGMAPLPSIIMQKAVSSFKTVWQQLCKRAFHISNTAVWSVVSYCGEGKGRETKWLMLTTTSFGPSREMLVGRNFRNGGEFIRHFAQLQEGSPSPSQTSRELYSSCLARNVPQISAYTYEVFIHSLVFSLKGRAGRNQSPVMWPVWFWHTASWASSWGQFAIAFPRLQTFPLSPPGACTSATTREILEAKGGNVGEKLSCNFA